MYNTLYTGLKGNNQWPRGIRERPHKPRCRAGIARVSDPTSPSPGALMNSQEIETAVREQIPVVVLIWADGVNGLIEMEDGPRTW
jgi:Thiamine pyrophosphate enzyme, C-terminal TPP binding domain